MKCMMYYPDGVDSNDSKGTARRALTALAVYGG